MLIKKRSSQCNQIVIDFFKQKLYDEKSDIKNKIFNDILEKFNLNFKSLISILTTYFEVMTSQEKTKMVINLINFSSLNNEELYVTEIINILIKDDSKLMARLFYSPANRDLVLDFFLKHMNFIKDLDLKEKEALLYSYFNDSYIKRLYHSTPTFNSNFNRKYENFKEGYSLLGSGENNYNFEFIFLPLYIYDIYLIKLDTPFSLVRKSIREQEELDIYKASIKNYILNNFYKNIEKLVSDLNKNTKHTSIEFIHTLPESKENWENISQSIFGEFKIFFTVNINITKGFEYSSLLSEIHLETINISTICQNFYNENIKDKIAFFRNKFYDVVPLNHEFYKEKYLNHDTDFSLNNYQKMVPESLKNVIELSIFTY